MPTQYTFPLIAAAVLAFVAPADPSHGAQKTGRQQEVKIPGIDLSLKGGWQLLFHEGCRFAVPVSWHADADGSLARAPDGSNVSIRMFRITSWSTYKARIKAAFGAVNALHEDSDRRLWFEIGDPARIQHHVDVSNGLSVCSGLLEIHAATTPEARDTTKRIAESIGPVPAEWRSGARQ